MYTYKHQAVNQNKLASVHSRFAGEAFFYSTNNLNYLLVPPQVCYVSFDKSETLICIQYGCSSGECTWQDAAMPTSAGQWTDWILALMNEYVCTYLHTYPVYISVNGDDVVWMCFNTCEL